MPPSSVHQDDPSKPVPCPEACHPQLRYHYIFPACYRGVYTLRPDRYPSSTRPAPSNQRPGLDAATASRWSSRASRKNRYSSRPLRLALRDEAAAEVALLHQRLHHPTTRLKLRITCDISLWVAIIFTLGSTAWIVNGFYLFLPLVSSAADHTTSAAWWAFAGGTLFEAGSYLMFVEALNTSHEQLFGLALWGLVHGTRSPPANDAEGLNAKQSPPPRIGFRWMYASLSPNLSAHTIDGGCSGLGSWRDLGFLACFVQMCAATIFWVSTITGLPGVIPRFPAAPPAATTDVVYWTPQVLGGCGFIIASALLMLEVQRRWWVPNLCSLGWCVPMFLPPSPADARRHVGLWNLFGAVGFTLCGALGYASLDSTKADYQSVLSTFWGSWAFLVGSVIQLWETLWREAPEPAEKGAHVEEGP
ncbi:hypothetical protein A0H81_01743 [Grifola frondosa]|uniref:Integral membrane protein n=1 Tax=Grifola frondosa TaxID=5627 RepID=A0A1C7ML37_GRIFR|nr:hypothetical protein A0H81_01743 [Grifola frondosa]